MRHIASLFLAVYLTTTTLAQTPAEQTHPFSVHDMMAMDRLSDARVSPDGRWVVFVLSRTDLEANRRRTDLWLIGTDGTPLRRLPSHP